MVLEKRCEYFRAMFNHGLFKEANYKNSKDGVSLIELRDVPPEFFFSIHTYIYTDEVVVYRKEDLFNNFDGEG